MKKLLIFAILLMISQSPVYAQDYQGQITDINTRLNMSGVKLREYSKMMYTGIGMQFTGVVFTAGGIMLQSQTEKGQSNMGATALTIGGGILTLAGTIFSIAAHNKIKQAGIILQGNGVQINLPYRQDESKKERRLRDAMKEQ